MIIQLLKTLCTTLHHSVCKGYLQRIQSGATADDDQEVCKMSWLMTLLFLNVDVALLKGKCSTVPTTCINTSCTCICAHCNLSQTYDNMKTTKTITVHFFDDLDPLQRVGLDFVLLADAPLCCSTCADVFDFFNPLRRPDLDFVVSPDTLLYCSTHKPGTENPLILSHSVSKCSRVLATLHHLGPLTLTSEKECLRLL